MAKNFISKERLSRLERSIRYLSNFTGYRDAEVVVGESLEEVDQEATDLLNEMVKLNKRREEIVELLTGRKPE